MKKYTFILDVYLDSGSVVNCVVDTEKKSIGAMMVLQSLLCSLNNPDEILQRLRDDSVIRTDAGAAVVFDIRKVEAVAISIKVQDILVDEEGNEL